MGTLFRHIDRLLRGGYTREEDLRDGRIDVPVGTLVVASLLLGATYGLFMGLYAALRDGNPTGMQLLAGAIKVPLLFLLTLVVTFPSLYVFSALSGSRLAFRQTLRLLMVAIGVDLALLASFAPVLGFFTLSTDSYPFLVLLNVALFAVSGVSGLVVLRRALAVVFHDPEAPTPEPEPVEKRTFAPPRRRRGGARTVFRIWILVYGVVGAQMGWILRPFIGAPDLAFEWFRARESNFFEAVVRALVALFL